MSTQQLQVLIMGQSYVLGCPEGGEDRLLAAVAKVDAAMCQIRDAGKIKTRERIAVLAALNLAFGQDAAPSAAPTDAAQPAVPSATLDAARVQRLTLLAERLDRATGTDSGHLF